MSRYERTLRRSEVLKARNRQRPRFQAKSRISLFVDTMAAPFLQQRKAYHAKLER